MDNPSDPANWRADQRRAFCLVAVVAAAQRADFNASGKPLLVEVTAQSELPHTTAHPLEQALLQAAADPSPADWQALLPQPSLYKPAASIAVAMLSGRTAERQIPLYAFQLLALAERLGQQPAIRNALAEQLQQLQPGEPADAATLAAIYQRTISKLGQRIQVSGKAEALQDPDRAAMIRALLLAGVRFAWLWRSLGGKRRHLVLGRRKLVATIESITRSLDD